MKTEHDLQENEGFNKTVVSSSLYNYTQKDIVSNTKVPIKKGCPNDGQCFCTGKCNEIIGWRDKLPNEF